MIFEENGIYVKAHTGGIWIVFRPSDSGTYSVGDSAYGAGIDGLSMAIARALYLAKGPGRHATEAMRLASR